jgi:hypothetical protein
MLTAKVMRVTTYTSGRTFSTFLSSRKYVHLVNVRGNPGWMNLTIYSPPTTLSVRILENYDELLILELLSSRQH